jgi:hypothetical protein
MIPLLRIGGNDGSLRLHVGKAITSRREVEPEEVLGNRWPGFGLEFQEPLDAFLNHTTGQHYSVILGDHVRELECLAELLGVWQK